MRPATSFRIGAWFVDLELGRLVHDDGVVRQPEPKALQLLVTLADHPKRPISRADLKASVWNGDHIAPGALKHLVWQLRRDLGDDATTPRYIETVRGRGYRLLRDVEAGTPPAPKSTSATESGSVSATASATGDEPGARPRPSRRIIVGAGVATLGALGLVFLAMRARPPEVARSDPPARSTKPAARPLTSLPGNEINPALAPDGSFVAFAWDGEAGAEGYGLFRMDVAGGAPEPLVRSDADDFEPAFSPDGRRLAYLRGDVDLGGQTLRVLDLETATDRVVAETAGRYLDVVGSHGVDDRWIVSERLDDTSPARLRSIASDGSARDLTEPPAQSSGDLFPAISSDGRQVAFVRRGREGSGDVMLLDLETGAARRLETAVGRVVGLAFDRSDSGLVVSSDRVPPRGIWHLPLDGGEARWLGLPGSFVGEPASSRTGSLVYQDQRCDANIWQAALATRDATRIAALASTRLDMSATFAPDGRTVALLSNRSGISQIWTAAWPDGRPNLVPSRGGPVLSMAWAPDSTRLVVSIRASSGVSTIHTLDLDGANQQLRSDPRVNSAVPSWSADGQAIYYSVWRDERWRVVRQGVDSGAVVDLGPGFAAREAPGGDALWLLDAGQPGLARRTPDGAVEIVVPFLSVIDASNWQPIEGGAIFLHWGRDRRRHLSRYTVEDGEIRTLLTLDRNLPYPPGLTVSPDGETVLWTRIDAIDSDLMIAVDEHGLSP